MELPQPKQYLADRGRGGDTIIAHITKEEAELLKERGGSGTINPDTGLPEFGFFSDLWNGFKSVIKAIAPIIMPAIAIFVPALIPGIGIALGATTSIGATALGAAALSAGVTWAQGGNLKDILSSAALAGADVFLSPMLGRALTTKGASELVQSMVGSAAFGAGYTALRGGNVNQMLAAAGTGAAGAYLGNLAVKAIDKMNNLMASGRTGATITQKGATDAVFAAADAANMKAAGFSQQQISQALSNTGLDATTSDYISNAVMRGMDADTIAANVAAGRPTGSYAKDVDANTVSITAGNNADVIQRISDANFVASDAVKLKQQGLSMQEIADNLMASGVDKNVATTVANYANRGMSANSIADTMTNQNFLDNGVVYKNTDDIINRNLGQAMDADQYAAFKAVPYKDQINAGKLTIDDANILAANGVTSKQFDDLANLGYKPMDIADMISAGVSPNTLTTLSKTKFAETTINDMLVSGVNANDIANASRFVDQGTLKLDTATTLLNKGVTGSGVAKYALSGYADQVADALTKGTSLQTIDQLASTNKLNTLGGVTKPVAPTGTTTTTTAAKPLSSSGSQQANQMISSGLVDVDTANILARNGYTSTDVKTLLDVGYTAPDLVDMVSVGIPANTLKNLANTKFAESTINDMLMSGINANDIANASTFVNNGTIKLDTAQALLENGIKGSNIPKYASSGYADQIVSAMDQGVKVDTINTLISTNKLNTLSNYIPITDIKSIGMSDAKPGTVFNNNDGTYDLVLNNGKVVDLAEYNNAVNSGKQFSVDNAIQTQTTQAGVPGGYTSDQLLLPGNEAGTIYTPPVTAEIDGGPKFAGDADAGTPPPGYKVAKPEDIFGPNNTNNGQKPFVPGSIYDEATDTWFTPTTPKVPGTVIPDITTTNQNIIDTITTTPVSGSGGGKPAGTTTTPIIPGTTTTGGTSTVPNINQTNQNIIDTITTNPVSGSGGGKPTVIPDGPTVPVTPDAPTKPVTPDTPTTPTNPYIPTIIPPIKEEEEDSGTYDYSWGTPPQIQLAQGLNPGWMTNVPQQYSPVSGAQSQYYWGGHPFQPGPTFNPQLYKNVPNAPVQPWGSQYAMTSATPQDIRDAMAGYPVLQPIMPD